MQNKQLDCEYNPIYWITKKKQLLMGARQMSTRGALLGAPHLIDIEIDLGALAPSIR
jgi:hypothetical protein